MFRNEKLVWPSGLHFALAATVALCAFGMNRYSPVIGYILAIVTMLLILLQFWFSFRVWPTLGHSANPYFFGLYWGLMFGLIVPIIMETIIEGGMTGILDLLNN
jgi:hypothetical protein